MESEEEVIAEAFGDGEAKQAKKAAKKTFCFRGRHIGLTYAQAGALREIEDFGFVLLAELQSSEEEGHRLPIDKFVIGRELHADGGVHYHCYLHFTKLVQTRNVRKFDLPTGEGKYLHPNIVRFTNKKTATQVDKWIDYCKKSGKWKQEGFLPILFRHIAHENYVRKRADLNAWEADAKKQDLGDPFPFQLPDGTVVNKPRMDVNEEYIKRRHWVLMGPPDAGKSRWMGRTFKGKAVYLRPMSNDKYPFEIGAYHQEQVVLYDDKVPKLQEFIDVGEIHELRKDTYGESRYTPNYWKQGQARVIVWLINPQNLPDYARRGHKNYEIFKARFNFLQYDPVGGLNDTPAWLSVSDTPDREDDPDEW